MNQKPSQNAKSIGARFRSARSLVLSLNRKSFCERYEINRYTMQSWENGLHVSKGKNVEKFIQALAREGIACSAEWLIDGSGEPARPFDERDRIEEAPNNFYTDPIADRLMAFYRESGQNFAFSFISDAAMSPWFNPGDLVFGIDITDEPERAHQKWCIVELAQRRQVVRKVIYFKDFLILCAEDKRVPTFTLSIGANIYEIIWHRLRQ